MKVWNEKYKIDQVLYDSPDKGKKWKWKIMGYQLSDGNANWGGSLKWKIQDWPSTLRLSRQGWEMKVKYDGLPVIWWKC